MVAGGEWKASHVSIGSLSRGGFKKAMWRRGRPNQRDAFRGDDKVSVARFAVGSRRAKTAEIRSERLPWTYPRSALESRMVLWDTHTVPYRELGTGHAPPTNLGWIRHS